jgi:dephospho-CoA kinase|tara:strand:- start:363 stop:959 length:597 start_codon:yes stop_codon:yes gene_type:complete
MIIGLTGGIGSGKSVAANHFTSHGITVIDADDLAKEVLEFNTHGYNEVLHHFGPSILDQSNFIDRSKLRIEVFNNPDKKQLLESIIHPLVRELMTSRIMLSQSIYSIVMVPLIYESQSMKSYDRILVLDCDESTQIERASLRDSNPKELIQKIMSTQCSREERLSIANDVLPNNGSLASLESKVKELHTFYLGICTDD